MFIKASHVVMRKLWHSITAYNHAILYEYKNMVEIANNYNRKNILQIEKFTIIISTKKVPTLSKKWKILTKWKGTNNLFGEKINSENVILEKFSWIWKEKLSAILDEIDVPHPVINSIIPLFSLLLFPGGVARRSYLLNSSEIRIV